MVQKILLTGATGYVGGTVLSTLLASKNTGISALSISVLVRRRQQAHLLESKGVRVLMFAGFDDDGVIRQTAAEHDAERKKQLGSDVYYIHISGTSSLADSPVLNLHTSHPKIPFSDRDPERITTTLQSLENDISYPQRTTDLKVLSLGEELHVRTYILYLPILYGIGTGDFNTISGQIPALMKATLRDGYTSVVGNGQGRKSHVHIEDVGSFCELILDQLLTNKPVPFGNKGVFFVTSGSQSYHDISKGISKAAVELKVSRNEELVSLTIDEAVKKLGWSDSKMVIELGFVSRSVTYIQLGPDWPVKDF
ncbi:hypothetical protein LTR84_008420 [Exophiala bonariae]|uniref:NAD-dependent epimerase/dehydratase domain-containing protein n=1 Tax=Exophiala bonariae TaxID=1690606 RepID=A0AAV9N0B6_9EURO|nr:hypothetical protein LTR84_008420 [Exophiala bonariae]